MGYDATDYTMIGVHITLRDLKKALRKTSEKVRGCSHPETKRKFCMDCGAPI
jgi:hypothetical protein